jgi:PAS domain S-box-containing protein
MWVMETAFYFAAGAFQLAAMVFALLMIRARKKRRPWQILFAALLFMFIFRVMGVWMAPNASPWWRAPLNSVGALTISVLLFASLLSLRKLALSERLGEQVYQTIGESIDYGIWICDAEGRNTYASPSFLQLVGLTQHECTTSGWDKVLHPDEMEKAAAAWAECVQTGDNWYREHRFKGADGLWHPILACGLPVRDTSGKITHWVGINLDIRRLKAVEERERAARIEIERQSRVKDEFLATVSHELRTPLNAIVGWAELIRRGSDNPKTVREGIDVIHRNAQAQSRLIEDLLDMSRIISGKLRLDTQSVDLSSIIETAINAVEPAASGKGVRLQKVLDPNAGPVSGDANRLQQVLWNLLSNAIKFTPKEGKVEVLLERVNSHLEISVSDTGEGIEPEFLPFVFERFRQADSSTTRKYFGLGLGLAITKNLVELHGGKIHARSAGIGKGSTFVVSLPLRVTGSESENRQHPAASIGKRDIDSIPTDLLGIEALVVDDDPDARELIARLLTSSQASVILASSAAEANAMLAQKRPNVIISDIGMPGQDGYQFMHSLRKDGVLTPAIALTAFARPEDRMRALQAGYQMHLAKPVDPAELITVVGSMTGRLSSE